MQIFSRAKIFSNMPLSLESKENSMEIQKIQR